MIRFCSGEFIPWESRLKKRGDITIWFSEESISKWNYAGPKQKGAQFKYSDMAIEAGLVIKKLFRLPFRQTEGFLNSLAFWMEVDIEIPNYSTLCRRQQNLDVKITSIKKNEPMHIVFDSTGLKVYGEGEWKVRLYGAGKRRTWRKLHIIVDGNTGEILSGCLTSNSEHDCEPFPALLEKVEGDIEAASGDGGYDKNKVYQALKEREKKQGSEIKTLIPPQENARILGEETSDNILSHRNKNIRYICEHGKEQWKQSSGYHRRSIAENVMFRYKTIHTLLLYARKMENQSTEIKVGFKILNQMNSLGMPVSEKGI